MANPWAQDYREAGDNQPSTTPEEGVDDTPESETTHETETNAAGWFGDVVEGAYFSEPVAALAALGVLAGTECGAGLCPHQPVDRKTMAVWTVRILDGLDPPTVSEARFDDVDADSFYAPFVERMAQLRITLGCGDGTGFCPDDTVTRAHMAVFLSRAFGLPDGPDPGFGDVAAGAWYATEVAALAASGITRGCGDGTEFCPDQATFPSTDGHLPSPRPQPDPTHRNQQLQGRLCRLGP